MSTQNSYTTQDSQQSTSQKTPGPAQKETPAKSSPEKTISKYSDNAGQQWETFDIFDTLLHRIVEKPIDLFYVVKSRLSSDPIALEYPEVLNNFQNYRRRYETSARDKRAAETGGEREVTLDEIYKELQEQTGISDQARELLKKTELETEFDLLYQSLKGKALVDNARKSGKKIAYISDMYLPEEILRDLLEHNGFPVENVPIFVSGKERTTKHSGGLYDLVQETLQINPANWLHTGDNFYADVEVAAQKGIQTRHANYAVVNNTYSPRPGRNSDAIADSVWTWASLPQADAFKGDDPYERLGFEVFGPTFLGFTAWLSKNVREMDINELIFFARDGYFLLQAFQEMENIYFPHEDQRPETDYVYTSRAAMYPMSMTDISHYRVGFNVGGRARRNLRKIFKTLGLNADDFNEYIREWGFTGPEHEVGHEDFWKTHGLLRRTFKEILEASKENKEKYGKYFKDFIQDKERIGLVDIGWAGNMQTNLMRILDAYDDDLEITAFNVGTNKTALPNHTLDHPIYGWILNDGEIESSNEIMRRGGVELMEFALTANHGTTLGYEEQEDGSFEPVLEDKKEDELDYEAKALKVQKGALNFISTIGNRLGINADSTVTWNWAEPFWRLAWNPSPEQVELLSQLPHSDVVSAEAVKVPLAKKLSPEEGRDAYRHELRQSFWKSAFKQLNSQYDDQQSPPETDVKKAELNGIPGKAYRKARSTGGKVYRKIKK